MFLQERIEGFVEAPAKLSPNAKILMDAAGLIRQRGLAKWTREDDSGSLCIHGAISLAEYENPWYGDDGVKSEALLSELAERGVDIKQRGGVAWWNNSPERTAEEVIDLLEATAQRF